MEFLDSVVVWIFINTILPLLPILASFWVGNLFFKGTNDLKWYQFLSRNEGLALYASLISISSLSTPILSLLSKPNLADLVDSQEKTIFIIVFIALVLIFIASIIIYAILLYRNMTVENLYSPENDLAENKEKTIAYIILFLALAATIFSLVMKFLTEGL
ncbi:MAG: hypothetical protein AAFQ80_12590 [Cyanobacteria bacterium J06621_8]